ncbi:hypothetical protein KFE25_014056 [Diacronema lutheri]|uniref:B-related factor 1 n=2 Tax=Diacronema lutheri TaxID=2081491 RepID=A0A8J6BZU8_DIALT|nr:hypothetical protein KFE25_014056 [Diacronema lutheri]
MLVCQICGSTETDYDAAKGDTVCVNCGTVIEENTIVSEVQFAEDANGASSVVGQFISSNGTGMSSSFAKESREITISNGRRKISHIAGALSLNSHHVEAAQRFFLLAVQHNFIQGRRTQHVVAACLYIVCRREKTPHMLIDFSDVLQTNVFALGSTFLKFTRLLNLQLPLIDPSLYIHRFASRLELGDKMHTVSILALRLVQRMKRDWIQTGRRPSGICGAALLVASRVHGFRRTQRELVHIVRICDVTLRKRLCEFEETACGALTAQELGSINLDQLVEADPPAFTRNRRIEALVECRDRFIQLPRATPLVHARAEPCAGRIAQLPLAQAVPISATALVLVQAVAARSPPGAVAAAHQRGAPPVGARTAGGGAAMPLAVVVAAAAGSTPARSTPVVDAELVPGAAHRALPTSQLIVAGSAEERAGAPVGGATCARAAEHAPASARPRGRDNVGAGEEEEEDGEEGGDDGEEGEEGVAAPRAPREREGGAGGEGGDDGDEGQLDVEEDTLSDLSDSELETYLISDSRELTARTQLWTELNHDWLAYRSEKDAQAAAAAAHGDDGSKRKNKRKARDKGGTAGTAAEAAEAALAKKRISSNLNYDVLNGRAMQEDIAASNHLGAPARGGSGAAGADDGGTAGVGGAGVGAGGGASALRSGVRAGGARAGAIRTVGFVDVGMDVGMDVGTLGTGGGGAARDAADAAVAAGAGGQAEVAAIACPTPAPAPPIMPPMRSSLASRTHAAARAGGGGGGAMPTPTPRHQPVSLLEQGYGRGAQHADVDMAGGALVVVGEGEEAEDEDLNTLEHEARGDDFEVDDAEV